MHYRTYEEKYLKPWHVLSKPIQDNDPLVLTFGNAKLELHEWFYGVSIRSPRSTVTMHHWKLYDNKKNLIHVYKPFILFANVYDNWEDFLNTVRDMCIHHKLFTLAEYTIHTIAAEDESTQNAQVQEEKKHQEFIEKLRNEFKTKANEGKTSEELYAEREAIFQKHAPLHRWFDENLTVHYHELYRDGDICIMTDELTHQKEGTTTIVARMYSDLDIFATYKVNIGHINRLYDICVDSKKTADYERYCKVKSDVAQGATDFIDLIIKQVHMLNGRTHKKD